VIANHLGNRQAQEVREETWGHLRPKLNHKYYGYVVFAYSAWGELVLIDAEFTGLDSSPWLYDDLIEFVDSYEDLSTGVYRWDGWYKRFQNENCQFQANAAREVSLVVPS